MTTEVTPARPLSLKEVRQNLGYRAVDIVELVRLLSRPAYAQAMQDVIIKYQNHQVANTSVTAEKATAKADRLNAALATVTRQGNASANSILSLLGEQPLAQAVTELLALMISGYQHDNHLMHALAASTNLNTESDAYDAMVALLKHQGITYNWFSFR